MDHKDDRAPSTDDLKTDAFESLRCWRRLLRESARRSNQSILKEINPEHSSEGLILKLKLQCFAHLMQRANSLEKTLTPGKIEGKRRGGWQRMRRLGSITDSMGMNLSKLRAPADLGSIWVPLFCSSYITSLGPIFLIRKMGIISSYALDFEED